MIDIYNSCSHVYENEDNGEMLCDISESPCRFTIPKNNCNLNKPMREEVKRRKEKFV